MEPRKNADLWYAPNGRDIVTWHCTPSKQKSLRDFLADMKRAGLVYPPSRKRKGR